MIIQICVKLMLIWIFCLDANIESYGMIVCSATTSYALIGLSRKIRCKILISFISLRISGEPSFYISLLRDVFITYCEHANVFYVQNVNGI